MNPSSANAAPAAETKAAETKPAETKPQAPKALPRIDPSTTELLALITEEHERKMLIAQELERRQFSDDWRLAQVLADAGYFDDGKMTQAQAMARIEIGRSWGINQADSVRFIYIINGKPAVEESVYAARLNAAGWEWKPQFIGGEGPNCKGVRLFIERDGKPFMKEKRKDSGEIEVNTKGDPIMVQVSVEFTEEHAKLIKAWENKVQVLLINKKGPWSDGWRANMMYWRAIAQFRRFYAPGILTGALLRDEARDIGPLDELEVSAVAQDKRPSVLVEADKLLKKASGKPVPEPAAADPDPDKQPFVVESAETKAQENTETTAPVPPTAATMKQFNRKEALLTNTVFWQVLNLLGHSSLETIKTEAEAQTILQALDKEIETRQQKKGSK
jgi:hypothetical protein